MRVMQTTCGTEFTVDADLIGKNLETVVSGKPIRARIEDCRWAMFGRSGNSHIGANADGTIIMLSRLIVGREAIGKHVDHINGDRLNNLKSNLRVCNNQQNIRNMRSKGGTSKYKGVSINKRTGAIYARIMVDGKNANRQRCQSEHEAALLYDSWATELFGEFAWLNASHFPQLEATS